MTHNAVDNQVDGRFLFETWKAYGALVRVPGDIDVTEAEYREQVRWHASQRHRMTVVRLKDRFPDATPAECAEHLKVLEAGYSLDDAIGQAELSKTTAAGRAVMERNVERRQENAAIPRDPTIGVRGLAAARQALARIDGDLPRIEAVDVVHDR